MKNRFDPYGFEMNEHYVDAMAKVFCLMLVLFASGLGMVGILYLSALGMGY